MATAVTASPPSNDEGLTRTTTTRIRDHILSLHTLRKRLPLPQWRVIAIVCVVIAGFTQLWFVSFASRRTFELKSSHADMPSLLRWAAPPKFPSPYHDDRDTQNITDTDSENPGIHEWARPLVIAAAAVPIDAQRNSMHLFLYAQGLQTPEYKIRVVGCMVGEDVYATVPEMSWFGHMCLVPRTITKNESLSLVVLRDHTLTRVLSGSVVPLEFPRGTSVIHDTDLIPLPSHLHLDNDVKNYPSQDLFSIRSIVQWSDQMDPPSPYAEYRYEICAMTMEKLFPEHLQPWIDYHSYLGIDKFYIFDNTYPDSSSPSLFNNLQPSSHIEVIKWPWSRSQMLALNYFLVYARRRCEWIALMDVDEYILPGTKALTKASHHSMHPLHYVLQHETLPKYQSIYMPEVIMSSSGHHKSPNTTMPNAYTFLDPSIQPGSSGKSISLTTAIYPKSRVHYNYMLPQHRMHVPTHYIKQFGCERAVKTSTHLFVIHFKTRAWVEHVRKAHGERGSMMVHNWNASMNAARLNPDRPPKKHLSTHGQEAFTTLRDYARALAAEREPLAQHVVISRGSSRCVAKLPQDANAPEGPLECSRPRRTPPSHDEIVYANVP